MSIYYAIIPINKTCEQSQTLHQASKACIQQETLTHVTQTWRQKEEAIHWIQHLWQQAIRQSQHLQETDFIKIPREVVSLESLTRRQAGQFVSFWLLQPIRYSPDSPQTPMIALQTCLCTCQAFKRKKAVSSLQDSRTDYNKTLKPSR